MSYTIIDDNPDWDGRHTDRRPTILNIRAVISTRTELQELIEKLNRRLETDFAQEGNHDGHRLAEPLHTPDAPWITAAGGVPD